MRRSGGREKQVDPCVLYIEKDKCIQKSRINIKILSDHRKWTFSIGLFLRVKKVFYCLYSILLVFKVNLG